MWGTIVNSLAILLGSIIGFFFRGGIPERFNETLMNGLGLCVLYIGISDTLKGKNFLLIIFSIVIGGVIGELIDIDKRIQSLGQRIENKIGGNNKVAQGFVTGSLVYCIGAMAIVGSMESGLSKNYNTLYAKSVLDGVSSIVFASSLGVGVAFSSFSVLIYQGIITLGAGYLKFILTENVVADMTAIGGLLIIGIGLNMLKTTKIKVANLLLAVFIPILYQIVLLLF